MEEQLLWGVLELGDVVGSGRRGAAILTWCAKVGLPPFWGAIYVVFLWDLEEI